MPISRIATWKVSFAVMASRVLGLVREIIFAACFGGSKWMDCFYLAFKVPNLLRDLFAEGALSQAFVTTFTKRLKEDGDMDPLLLQMADVGEQTGALASAFSKHMMDATLPQR